MTAKITRDYKFSKGVEKEIVFNNIETNFDKENNIDYIKVGKNNLGLNIESILKILARKISDKLFNGRARRQNS